MELGKELTNLASRRTRPCGMWGTSHGGNKDVRRTAFSNVCGSVLGQLLVPSSRNGGLQTIEGERREPKAMDLSEKKKKPGSDGETTLSFARKR